MSSQLKGRERRDFWLLTVAQFQVFCGFFSFFQFPVFIKAVGGSETAIGVMSGLGALASTAFIPWIADFVNRSERRRLMQVGIAATTASTLGALTITAPNAWMASLLISRGLGFALYNNAAGAYVAEILPPSERSRWIGVNFGVNQIAVAVGPALAELLITHVGFPAFFIMAAGFELSGLALLTILTARAPRPGAGRLGVAQVGRAFFRTLAGHNTRHLYLTLLLMACALGAVFNFTATHLRGIGLSSGLFFTVYALVNGGSRMVGGGLSDRLGRAVVVIPSLSLFAAGLMVDSMVSGTGLMAISAVLIGLGFGMSNPTLLAQLLDRSENREQGRVIGGFYFAYQLGTLGASPVFGVAAEHLGYPVMWRMAAAVMVAAIGIYAWTETRPARAGRPAAGPPQRGAD
jgi:MFS family permease